MAQNTPATKEQTCVLTVLNNCTKHTSYKTTNTSVNGLNIGTKHTSYKTTNGLNNGAEQTRYKATNTSVDGFTQV